MYDVVQAFLFSRRKPIHCGAFKPKSPLSPFYREYPSGRTIPPDFCFSSLSAKKHGSSIRLFERAGQQPYGSSRHIQRDFYLLRRG